jgi:hypothetical protein
MSYEADDRRARRLFVLVEEGFAASLLDAATRFAISHPGMGTILVGMATPQQFEDALAADKKEPYHPPHSIPCRHCCRTAELRHKDRDARWTVKFTKAKPREDAQRRQSITRN